jgi:hypothetical protein
VTFVRKRDPRYKAYLKVQSQPLATSPLPNIPGRQADIVPATVYVEQEWQKTSVSGVEDLEWALAEGNDDPDVFECVPCGKSFKSEAAWSSHERSKKHIKNVEVLRRQMGEEAIQLGLPVNLSDGSEPELTEGSKRSGVPATPPVDDGLDKEHGTRNKDIEKSLESQSQTTSVEETMSRGADGTGQILPQGQNQSKRDKRRLREAKKQAQAVEDAHVSDW